MQRVTGNEGTITFGRGRDAPLGSREASRISLQLQRDSPSEGHKNSLSETGVFLLTPEARVSNTNSSLASPVESSEDTGNNTNTSHSSVRWGVSGSPNHSSVRLGKQKTVHSSVRTVFDNPSHSSVGRASHAYSTHKSVREERTFPAHRCEDCTIMSRLMGASGHRCRLSINHA